MILFCFKITVDQLFFASEKFLRSSQESRRREYFSPRASHCRGFVITTQVCIRVNREIMSRIKIGLQYAFITQEHST